MARRTPVVYLAFDLLYLDWRPTLDLPYRQRRELLDGLALAGPSWQAPPAFTGAAGADVLAAAVGQGLEGVVAKRMDARYRPGAAGTWPGRPVGRAAAGDRGGLRRVDAGRPDARPVLPRAAGGQGPGRGDQGAVSRGNRDRVRPASGGPAKMGSCVFP